MRRFGERRALSRRTLLAGAVGLGAAQLATACGASAPGGSAGSAITLYTSEPQAKIDQLIAAFNGVHPDIAVEVFRAGTGELTARIESELAAGEVQADVLLAADAGTFDGYKAEDLLLAYTPAGADQLNPDVIDPDGFYVGTRIIPTVIAYHSEQITAPPTSWQELTDPGYRDQIILPNPEVSGAAAYNAAVWLTDDRLGRDWLTGLAANEMVAESNGPVSQGVADGSRPIGIVVDYLIRDLAGSGSPIAVSYPSEGVPYVSQPIAIFAASAQPVAAQRFVDFVVGVEGQQLAVQQSYLPVRGDVGTPQGAPPIADLILLNPDPEVIAESQDEAVKLFGELFN